MQQETPQPQPDAPPLPTAPPAPAGAGAVESRPPVAAAADLAAATPAKRWLVLCGGLSFLIYVALIPQFLRFNNPPTGDQPFYLMDTISLVQDGDLNVANNYAQRDEDKFYKLAPHPVPFVGQDAPYPLPPQLAATHRPPAEQYGYHPPGLGLLLVPAWLAGGLFALWWPATIVFMALVGALVGLNIFLLAYQLTGRLGVAWAVWLPLAFSNPIMTYSFLIFTELPAGLLVLYAFRRLAAGWRANRPWQLVLSGAAIGYIPWLAWRCLPISAGLGVYAAVQWWRARQADRPPQPEAAPAGRRAPGLGRSIGAGLWLGLPALGLLLLLAAYDRFLFGTLTPNTVPGVGGEPAVFNWPWSSELARMQFVNGAFALFFDQQWGLLPHAPIYVLAGAGMVAMWRLGRGGDRRLLGWMALVALPYLGEIAAFNYWGGLWCPPARYLTTLVPLLAAPLALSLLALGRSWLYRALYGLLALPGFAYIALTMRDPRLWFPVDRGHFWSWLAAAPESPLHINLREVLPTFAWPDEIRQPVTTGWIIGAALLITLAGALLVARLPASRRRPAWPRLYHALAWLGAFAVIGGGWQNINAEYLKHKTVLVQEHRWELIPPPQQALGVAYQGGTVFIADYRGGTLGALDTATGTYRLLTPRSAGGALAFAHPGDVKVGPDGLLYVLNNGADAQALLVMRPDGEVVREIALPGTSQIATGLSFASGGRLYVSDMIRGLVLAYAPTGGPAQASLGGLTNGFNNVSTVVIAPDGMVYAAELGTGRVQQMDATGAFIRKYDLGCQSWGLAISGDWLDATCGAGLLSVNLQTQHIQSAAVAGSDPQLTAPTGLTYMADGTLYVVDQHALIAYHVEH